MHFFISSDPHLVPLFPVTLIIGNFSASHGTIFPKSQKLFRDTFLDGRGSLDGREKTRRTGRGRDEAGGGRARRGTGAEAAEPDRDPAWVDGVRRGLLDWYREAGRTLPWRADRDAYRILVSEMMLVQTTVAAVIPYFERFLRRFPDVRTLAEADEAEVLKAWEGLGYYRRARQLQAAARQVVREHGGTIPDDPDGVRALPGVGPYIAGAVLSFAFDRPEPIVEANSQRVLARLVALREDVKSAAARRRIWQAAGRLVPPRGAGDFNQAMMDLGALVCTPRQPSCLLCPVAAHCGARRLGLQDVIPRTTPEAAADRGLRGLCPGRPAAGGS